MLWPQENISVSNNVQSCIIKSNQKMQSHVEGQLQGN